MSKYGKENSNWRGGRWIDRSGRVWLYCRDHPRAHNNKVLEHILVMEKALGRFILSTESIHHIDRSPGNNNIGNLILFKTHNMHAAYHVRLTAHNECGHYEWKKCKICHKYDSQENLFTGKNKYDTYHKLCSAELARYRRAGGTTLYPVRSKTVSAMIKFNMNKDEFDL